MFYDWIQVLFACKQHIHNTDFMLFSWSNIQWCVEFVPENAGKWSKCAQSSIIQEALRLKLPLHHTEKKSIQVVCDQDASRAPPKGPCMLNMHQVAIG